MSIPVRIPDIETMGEPIKIGDWLIETGQDVQLGDYLVELMIPGIVYVLSADSEGVLGDIVRKREQVVAPGEVIAWMGTTELPPTDEDGQ